MNEEEKRALKVINTRTKRLLDELKIEKEDMSDEPRIAYLMQEIRANKTLLNLIEKLQKENEELKSNNEKYIIHLTDGQYKTVIEIAQNDINQKWIQKVKDKIEKLKINLVNMQGEELLIYESKIDVLQELLEGRK